MLQSQLQSARCNTKGTPPSNGVRIRDYALIDAAGNPIVLSNFRGKRNLVLIFAGTRQAGEVIASRLSPSDREFGSADTLAIIILADEPAWRSEQPHILIASDVDAIAHKEISGTDQSVKFVQGCYITDRFGEVIAAMKEIPPVDEIFRWLDFINSQCPECEPPEWPVTE